MIEAEVGDDSVKPSVETAIEAELGEVAVDAQEDFLEDVAGVFLRAEQIVGHAQDIVVVRAHKFVESAGVATLGGANKIDFS